MQKWITRLTDSGFQVTREPGKVTVKNNTVTIEGQADNTLWTTFGVLCQECYAFSDSSDYIVFDIGLNIGVSALYFAQYPNVKHVYAFEPFPATYRQAVNNLKNNPQYSEKISTYNFGIGGSDKEVSVVYNAELPGSMSTVIDRYEGSGPAETVKIKDVADVFAPFFSKHTEKIMVKMDCEGGEIEIIPRMESAGLLASVDVFQMEWHFSLPTELIDILTRNNFMVFFDHVIIGELGFLRAVNKRSL